MTAGPARLGATLLESAAALLESAAALLESAAALLESAAPQPVSTGAYPLRCMALPVSAVAGADIRGSLGAIGVALAVSSSAQLTLGSRDAVCSAALPVTRAAHVRSNGPQRVPRTAHALSSGPQPVPRAADALSNGAHARSTRRLAVSRLALRLP